MGGVVCNVEKGSGKGDPSTTLPIESIRNMQDTKEGRSVLSAPRILRSLLICGVSAICALSSAGATSGPAPEEAAPEADPLIAAGIEGEKATPFWKVDELRMKGHDDQALDEIARIIASPVDDAYLKAEAFRRKGYILTDDGDYSRAADALKQAEATVEAITNDTERKQGLVCDVESTVARLYMQMGKFAEARDIYLKLMSDGRIRAADRIMYMQPLLASAQERNPHDMEAVPNALKELIKRASGTRVIGEAYKQWAVILIQQKRYPDAQEKVDAASRIVGYAETYNLQAMLAVISGNSIEPPCRDAVFVELGNMIGEYCPYAAYAWRCLNGYEDVPANVKEKLYHQLATLRPNRSDIRNVSAVEVASRAFAEVRIMTLAALGKHDMAMKELDALETVKTSGFPFSCESLRGYAQYLKGQLWEAEGRQEDAEKIYRKCVTDTQSSTATRYMAVTALVGMVAKGSRGIPSEAVSAEIKRLMNEAQPATFKGHINIAWAEWLTDHGDFAAAKSKLDGAARILGENSLDVKEGIFLLKKAEEGRKAR